jgi:hypothetical protein
MEMINLLKKSGLMEKINLHSMSHDHPTLLMLGGMLTGMAGVLLIAYSPNWRYRGHNTLATLFLLAGFALMVTGAIIIATLVFKSSH